MPKPLEPEPRRSDTPVDNLPGHRPDQIQDKPVAKFRRRAVKVAADAHERQAEPQVTEIEIGDLRFQGLLAGRPAGDLVVLLHGFPQTSSAWEPQLRALAEGGYHVWAPDQRGYSPGARPSGAANYRLDLLVGDVIAMAEKLGHHTFHLVGHDWGGAVAWAAAARYPERVRSLTVVSTPHPRAFADSLWRSDQLLRSGYMAVFSAPLVPELLFGTRGGRVLRLILARSGLPEEAVKRYSKAMIDGRGLSYALNWYRALRLGSARVPAVKVPTLYIWSDRDVALGPAAAKATSRYVDGPYRLEVLEGASHWLPETRSEDLTRLILGQIGAEDGRVQAS